MPDRMSLSIHKLIKVLRERIELSWACARAILNRVRLPIPPSEQEGKGVTIK
jgi:hypothetical protein